jgi:hypothetical protein
MKLRMNWAVGIVTSYVLFAAGTTGFVLYAMNRPVDLVAVDYYEQSLRQDRQMDAVRHARDLGGAASIVQTTDREVVVTLPRQQMPITGWITLYRASDAAADRVFALKPDRDGRDPVSLAGLRSGVWSVRVRWTAQGREFYLEQRVFVR